MQLTFNPLVVSLSLIKNNNELFLFQRMRAFLNLIIKNETIHRVWDSLGYSELILFFFIKMCWKII
jgi:hypothetical protein